MNALAAAASRVDQALEQNPQSVASILRSHTHDELRAFTPYLCHASLVFIWTYICAPSSGYRSVKYASCVAPPILWQDCISKGASDVRTLARVLGKLPSSARRAFAKTVLDIFPFKDTSVINPANSTHADNYPVTRNRDRVLRARKRKRCIEADFKRPAPVITRWIGKFLPFMTREDHLWVWTLNYRNVQSYLKRLAYCSRCRPLFICDAHRTTPVVIYAMPVEFWHEPVITELVHKAAHKLLFFQSTRARTFLKLRLLYPDLQARVLKKKLSSLSETNLFIAMVHVVCALERVLRRDVAAGPKSLAAAVSGGRTVVLEGEAECEMVAVALRHAVGGKQFRQRISRLLAKDLGVTARQVVKQVLFQDFFATPIQRTSGINLCIHDRVYYYRWVGLEMRCIGFL